MKMVRIEEKSVWERFFSDFQDKTFLQSWGWGEFQERMGHKIWRLGSYGDKGLASAILAVKIRAKRGTFLLVQHNLDLSAALLNKLKEIAKEEGCAFIRMAPLLLRNKENKKLFQRMRFRTSPMHANAYEATWKLDITPSEEDLLKNMRKSTRYLSKA